MKKGLWVSVVMLLMIASTGCLRRIASFDSQPQGAAVYLDRKLIGETPCSHEFLYYGTHYLELTKEGYANTKTQVRLKGPFYEYFPFSIVSELLLPWDITDQHNFSFQLEPGQSDNPVISPVEQPQPKLSSPELLRVVPR